MITNQSESDRSSNPRAFTLIELLVVIAIIAILAAMLFARAGQGETQSHAHRRPQQSKQIGLAYHVRPRTMTRSYHFKLVAVSGAYFALWRRADGSKRWQVFRNRMRTNNPLFNYAPNVGTFHCPGTNEQSFAPAVAGRMTVIPERNDGSEAGWGINNKWTKMSQI